MIKTADFIDQYRKGKVSSATLIKMAAFKDELEKALADGTLTKNAAWNPFKWLAPKVENIASAGLGGLSNVTDKAPVANQVANRYMGAILGGLVFGGSMTTFQEILKGLEGKYVDWRQDIDKERKYKEMLTVHPDMKELPEDRVKLYYEALWHFSPIMGENPLAAGAYIKQAMKYDHVAQGPLPQSIQELTMIEKSKAQSDQARKGDSTLTTIMSPFNTAVGSMGKIGND